MQLTTLFVLSALAMVSTITAAVCLSQCTVKRQAAQTRRNRTYPVRSLGQLKALKASAAKDLKYGVAGLGIAMVTTLLLDWRLALAACGFCAAMCCVTLYAHSKEQLQRPYRMEPYNK